MDECIICLENLKYNILTLTCNHKYHYNCIITWAFKKKYNIHYPKCPLCDINCEIINIENIYPEENNDLIELNNENNENNNLIELNNENNDLIELNNENNENNEIIRFCCCNIL